MRFGERDHGKALGEVELKRRLRSSHLRAEDRQHLPHHGVNVHRAPARPPRAEPQHVSEDALAEEGLLDDDVHVGDESRGLRPAKAKILPNLFREREEAPDGVVHVVGDGAGEGGEPRADLRFQRLGLEVHALLRVAERDRRGRQEPLDDFPVVLVEGEALESRDLEKAEQGVVEKERRRQDAPGPRERITAVVVENVEERLLEDRLRILSRGEGRDRRRIPEQSLHLVGQRNFVADESALRLGPGDLVRLHPQESLPRIVDEESGRVIVVKKLVQSVQDLIREVPRAKLGDDFLLDTVEDPGQPLLLPAGEVLCQHRGQSIQRPPLTPVELSFVSLDSDEGLDAAVHPHRRQEKLPRNLGPLLSKEATDEDLVAKPRGSELVLLAHRAVLPEGPAEPDGVRSQVAGDRREEVVVDLRERPEALQVVLERAREGAARKAREIEHGGAASQDETAMLAQLLRAPVSFRRRGPRGAAKSGDPPYTGGMG